VKLPNAIEAHNEVDRFDVVRVQGTAQDGRLFKLYIWSRLLTPRAIPAGKYRSWPPGAARPPANALASARMGSSEGRRHNPLQVATVWPLVLVRSSSRCP
jgi:hypothetical protein